MYFILLYYFSSIYVLIMYFSKLCIILMHYLQLDSSITNTKMRIYHYGTSQLDSQLSLAIYFRL